MKSDLSETSEYEIAFNRFSTLIDDVKEKLDMNEAQVRLEVINIILSECLGWQLHENINVEVHADGGYADYILSTTRDIAVLEAKRQSVDTLLPVGNGKPEIFSLTALLKSSNDNLTKALEQSLQYAQNKGIPIAIISNGVQFIAFIASRADGVPPLKGRAIVYSSLEQIQDNFVDFWNDFSKPGMASNELYKKLTKNFTKDIPAKPSSLIIEYPGVYGRNSLQDELMTLSELVLEDLTHNSLEKEFLKDCYCETGSFSQYSALARDVVQNRYEQLNDTSGIKIERVPAKKSKAREILNASISRRPIILIGDVGVGKTTFIRNLIISDGGLLSKSDIALHVDLGESAILSSSVKSGALSRIKKILLDDYKIDIDEDTFARGVYHDEIERMKSGIYKSLDTKSYMEKEIVKLEELMTDEAEHVKQSIDYIINKSTGKQKPNIVIFLDNTDQRSSEDQQEIFLIAHELSTQSMATVFVSIRPETFYLSHKKGVLKAYHSKVFTIEPPRIDLVLRKRLQFGLRIAQGEINVPLLQGQSIKLTNLTTMLQVMLRALESDKDEYMNLKQAIDNLSGGNTRQAVDMVKEFLSSGHTNTRKILDIEQYDPETYMIPMHEFMKTIIYSDNKYYDPLSSRISNVFGITSKDPKEYFLKLILLSELINLGASDIAERGFVNTKYIYGNLQGLGYLPEQIDNALEYCLKEQLIENPINNVLYETDKLSASVRIVNKGAIYVKMLAGNFQYVDAILVDTPIVDKDLLKKIVDSYNSHEAGIEARMLRANSFIEYLSSCFEGSIKLSDDERAKATVENFFSQFEKSLNKTNQSYQRSLSRRGQ